MGEVLQWLLAGIRAPWIAKTLLEFGPPRTRALDQLPEPSFRGVDLGWLVFQKQNLMWPT